MYEYVKRFEDLGFGMFVHFGLYSVIGMGEWAKKSRSIPWEEYLKTLDTFCPKADWAQELVLAAKEAGCKYITLTTRHHDGFSLYDAISSAAELLTHYQYGALKKCEDAKEADISFVGNEYFESLSLIDIE